MKSKEFSLKIDFGSTVDIEYYQILRSVLNVTVGVATAPSCTIAVETTRFIV